MKPRLIGLDVGDKRIGVAISDPLGITAAGLETVQRHNTQHDVSLIADICKRHGAVEIIIGLPLHMDGTESEQSQKIQSFGKKLARAIGVPIIYEDERLTTISAIRTLTLQGVKTGHHKGLVDMVSAAIILQKYMDRQSPSPIA